MPRLFLVAAVLLGPIAALMATPRPALACSAGFDFNPVRDSEVIVAGRLSGWTEVEGSPEERTSGYAAVEVPMRIERVIKGAAPSQIVLFDHASLTKEFLTGAGRPRSWVGSGGSCGAFNADPTGQYAVLGLRRLPDGRYAPNLLLVFYIGDAPSGERYEAALRRMSAYGPVSLPSTGIGAAGHADRGGTAALVPIAILMLTITGVGLGVHRRPRSRPLAE